MFHKMKTVNQQEKKNSIRDQLFIVNKSAGRLRLMLIVLLFTIYWAFIAQTEIAPLAISDNFLALFPEPTNFTSGIIQEILQQYFSPSTILFAVIPLIIFLSIRKMISRYLHLLLPPIGLKESERYLTKCAFSSSKQDLYTYENVRMKLEKIQEHLKLLGGPASFTFDPSSAFIIQNINNRDYFLFSSDYQSNTEKYFLSHGDKIYAVVSKGDRNVLLKNLKTQDKFGRTIDFNLISLLFNFNNSQKESEPFLSRKITMHDARLLSYLGSVGRNIIHQFLHDETQNFLHNNVSIIFHDKSILSSINQVDKKILDVAPKKNHRIYAENTPATTEKPHGVNRKHKHSRYVFLKKKSEFSLNTKDGEANRKQLIIQLSNHLNEQLKSFFHISTIQISIIEIGKITING